CFRLLAHDVLLAFSLALANTGNRIAASRLIIATTTRSSINVNPGSPLFLFCLISISLKSTFILLFFAHYHVRSLCRKTPAFAVFLDTSHPTVPAKMIQLGQPFPRVAAIRY